MCNDKEWIEEGVRFTKSLIGRITEWYGDIRNTEEDGELRCCNRMLMSIEEKVRNLDCICIAM